MDLTKQFPRSPRHKAAGVAMLPRTIDKARAKLAGSLGEYIYDCPMDRQLFATLGVTAEDFLAAVRRSKGDDEVVAWARTARQLSDQAIAEHEQIINGWSPKSDEGRKHFERDRARLAPDRPDISTWTELIDIEEGRI